MSSLIHEFTMLARDGDGHVYRARCYGRERGDGTWVGWLEFMPRGQGGLVREPPHWYHSLDNFRNGYLPKHWDAARGPWSEAHARELFRSVLQGYLLSLRAMIQVGHRVISEAVILPATRDLYLDSLTGVRVFL